MGAPTVGIPYAYRDRVETEHKRLGSDSKIQTMKHILDVYFGNVEPNGAPNVNQGAATVTTTGSPPVPAIPTDAKPTEKREVYISYVDQET